jgi:hypothetical protein
MNNKTTKIAFWATTVLIFLFEGVIPAFTTNSQLAIEGVRHLGYPDYFRIMLSTFKVCGAIVLILPYFKGNIKEWAYAGFGFVFISAAVSHAAIDGIDGQTIFPLVMLLILVISYRSYHRLTAAKVAHDPVAA